LQSLTTPSEGTFAKQYRQPENTAWQLGQAGKHPTTNANFGEEPRVKLGRFSNKALKIAVADQFKVLLQEWRRMPENLADEREKTQEHSWWHQENSHRLSSCWR